MEGSRRAFIGTALMSTLFQDMRERKIKNMYVAILHQPVRNEASISFVEKLGFSELEEVVNPDHYTWGIYHSTI